MLAEIGWPLYALLGAGLVCGLLNTLASAGSAVSLPVLLMLGLPALEANATNRVSLMVGGLMALRTFQAQRMVDWRALRRLILPATFGSVVGVVAAEMLPGRDMGLVITGAVMMALLLLFTKVKAVLARARTLPSRVTPIALLALLGVGIWLGFIVVDGATYMLLVLMMLCHFDLPHANALKAGLLVATTLLPLALFAWSGSIWWLEGLLLSVGSLPGAYWGARRSVHERAKRWVFRILVVTMALEIVRLGVHYTTDAPRPAGQPAKSTPPRGSGRRAKVRAKPGLIVFAAQPRRRGLHHPPDTLRL